MNKRTVPEQLPLTDAIDVLTQHGKSPAQILESLTSGEAAAAETRAPTPHQRRNMHLAADSEFVAKFQHETSEELADRMVAEDKISLAAQAQPYVDQCIGAIHRMQAEREAAEPQPEFDWFDSQNITLHEQPETAIYFNKMGALVIRQRADWNEENDPFVYVCPNNIAEFIDKLCDIVGIPSAGKRTA